MAIDTDGIPITDLSKSSRVRPQNEHNLKLATPETSLDYCCDSEDTDTVESDTENYKKDTQLAKVCERNDTPQIFGAVTVSQSSDVHFGNKTYIHGPVTIKQVVGSKLSESGIVSLSDGTHGVLNSGFTVDNGFFDNPKINDNGTTGKNVDEPKFKCFGFTCLPFWRFQLRTIIIVCSFIVFAVLLSLVLSITLLDKNTDAEKVLLIGKTLRIVSRQEWIAQPPAEELAPLQTPVPYVIIAHTATENCTDQASCVFHVRFIQTFHLESRGWSDIGYNFLVGGDGSAYEGRGWDKVGAHTKTYNDVSIGIAFIGTFNSIIPPERQLLAAQRLIELGVALGKISKDYKLFGHRQLFATVSPGDKLFEEIQKWPHWSKDL